jgi:signal transduction histidine kinase/CheY-like chemotaxis protein
MPVHQFTEDEMTRIYVMREKAAHITKAARSATIANILAPLLCIPMFQEDVGSADFSIWLGYTLLAVAVRTVMVFSLEHEAGKIEDPQRNLRVMSYALGLVGLGWGSGWILMAPDLDMVNRMIYVYMTTAAMISSMFAYSVNRPTFLAFTLPIMIPSIGSVVWSSSIFPWPFTLGLASLYIVVLSIAKSFAKIFEDSVNLRFRNERLYKELASERDASVAANVAKSKFIAIASHDLRQPMHAVNVYLELLNIDNLPEPEKKSLTKIKNSITTLNDMFDSLLNTSKLDADVMQVSHRSFHLKELANTLRDLTETKASRKGLTLTVNCPDFIVVGDKLLLQQIISNLLSNAVQYTEAGEVSVTFDHGDEGLTIEVTDTGCGIDSADQQQIFNPFFRINRTRALHDGLGLGLSIVKRLCNLIGANVSVFSEVNKGSRFLVETKFPASLNDGDLHTTSIAPKVASQLHALHGKCIAVIEDNPLIVEAYRHTLANQGAIVHVLSEQIDELDAQLEAIDHIDCILCDYRLKQTTGDLVIERIRESYNDEIPAIIVTADTSPAHINFFSALNVQVLHKPISFQEIAHAIEKTIAAS